ncbi:MAG: uracil-DNA glycosylase [Verrucomicrobia bacterium]|nr:uracil-DNA glycosylase [Verrucomicrobiota bacterium]NBS79218.1 uracil-DNA glycosylase [bacterium]NBV96942.1 uracil-DNA glycosylase [Verrucomicrobiota bacterium]
MTCQICPHLAKSRKQVVFGVGDPEARLMFVGEAPGADEDELGEPFVGLSGKLLSKMLTAMELSREQVYIANVLKCRPDMPANTSGNRKPTRHEMEACLPYLRAQISIIAPVVIVALGSTAVEGLFGPQKTTISRLRGSWMEIDGVPVRPTFHPSYLLHNQNLALKREVWEDLLAAMERLSLPISEKQRGYFLKA